MPAPEFSASHTLYPSGLATGTNTNSNFLSSLLTYRGILVEQQCICASNFTIQHYAYTLHLQENFLLSVWNRVNLAKRLATVTIRLHMQLCVIQNPHAYMCTYSILQLHTQGAIELEEPVGTLTLFNSSTLTSACLWAGGFTRNSTRPWHTAPDIHSPTCTQGHA